VLLAATARIDEKELIIGEMFLVEFGEKHLGNRLLHRAAEDGERMMLE